MRTDIYKLAYLKVNKSEEKRENSNKLPHRHNLWMKAWIESQNSVIKM